MTATAPPPSPPPPTRSRSWTTLWYYVVVIGTLGMLSGVPFAHAASRLRGRPAGRWCVVWAVVYSAVAFSAMAVSSVWNTGGGAIAFGVMFAATAHLTFVRHVIARTPPGPRPVDPAVAAVLASRQARDRARAIVDSDPAMARELRIGRPDLPRAYDDGGLVDVNSAPAVVIAWACGVDGAVAEQLVAARAAAGVPFQRIDDAFVWTDIPVDLWDRIRDRAVCVV